MDKEKGKGIYYVNMTDRSMSGWGRAEGRINKLIFECKDLEEAQVVLENARARGDMTYINMSMKKRYYNEDKYYVQYKTKGGYSSWYVKDNFKNREKVSE